MNIDAQTEGFDGDRDGLKRRGPVSADLLDPDTPRSSKKLTGNLGVLSILFTVLAFNGPAMVSAGFVPVVIAYGNEVGAPGTFLVIGVVMTLFSVGLVAMSRFMRSPGAFYAYIATGLGRVVGLGGAFTAIGAYSFFGVATSIYGGVAVQNLVHVTLGGPDVPWWVWALVIWLIATVLSLFHIELSTKVLVAALVAEVLVVTVWAARVFFTGGAQGNTAEPFTSHAFFSGNPAIGLLYAVLCVTGFEAVAVFREEAKDPIKTVRRATYASVIFMAGFYAVIAWAYITAFGINDAVAQASSDPSGSFGVSMQTFVGTWAMDVLNILLVTSAFASVLANQNIGARYLYTLGSDGVLPKTLGQVHPRLKSPFIAAATFGTVVLVGILVPAIGGFEGLQSYATASGIGALCLLVLMSTTCVAVVVFFRKGQDHTATPWQSLVAPVLGGIGLITATVLAVVNLPDIIGGDRAGANIVISVIGGFGIAGMLTALVFRKTRPEIYLKIGKQDL